MPDTIYIYVYAISHHMFMYIYVPYIDLHNIYIYTPLCIPYLFSQIVGIGGVQRGQIGASL